MSREIKFRAWDKVDKLMYCDIHRGIKLDGGSEYSFVDFLDNKGYHEWIIMQFTGLHDKNGVEIYEGDIVKADGVRIVGHDMPMLTKMNDCRHKYKVEWDNIFSCWKFVGYKDSAVKYEIAIDVSKRHMEVISSVHESPDLIKETT